PARSGVKTRKLHGAHRHFGPHHKSDRHAQYAGNRAIDVFDRLKYFLERKHRILLFMSRRATGGGWYAFYTGDKAPFNIHNFVVGVRSVARNGRTGTKLAGGSLPIARGAPRQYAIG